MPKRVYEPLQKVILTDKRPRIGYVVADRKGSTGIFGRSVWQVRVATTLEEAQEHAHKLVNYDHVLPYTDDLWDAFQRLEKKFMDLTDLLHTLKKGKIPKELLPYVQGDFFTIESGHSK